MMEVRAVGNTGEWSTDAMNDSLKHRFVFFHVMLPLSEGRTTSEFLQCPKELCFAGHLQARTNTSNHKDLTVVDSSRPNALSMRNETSTSFAVMTTSLVVMVLAIIAGFSSLLQPRFHLPVWPVGSWSAGGMPKVRLNHDFGGGRSGREAAAVSLLTSGS